MSQFSITPDIVRVVITLKQESDLAKFKVYSNGENILINYKENFIDNLLYASIRR